MIQGLKRRLGIFFVFLSIILLLIYFDSDYNQNPNFMLLMLGVGSAVLAYFTLRGTRQPSEKAERFRLLKKLGSRKKKGSDSQE
jgi:hypothetical protein